MPPQRSKPYPRSEQESHRYVSAHVMLVDDADQHFFTFPEGKWRVQPDTQWYGGTISSYSGASTSDSSGTQGELEESLALCVDGFSISFVGAVPTNSTQPFYVSIDGSPPAPQTFAAPQASTSQGPAYREWFTTPFTDSEPNICHNLTFYDLPVGLSIDYALITHGYIRPHVYVGPQNFESNGGIGMLVADDSDPGIEWADGSGEGGGWDVLQREWNVSPIGSGTTGAGKEGIMVDAYGETVHASSTVGSSATVYFSGTEMSLSGFRPRGTASGGTISVSYRVDKGQEVVRNYGYDPGSSVSGGDGGFQQHFELYGVKGLEDGPHMLELSIASFSTPASTSSSPSPTFYIDYLTYGTTSYPFVQVASADGVEVPASFLQKMKVSHGSSSPGIKPQYIVGIVVLVVACLVLAWHGRRYMVIGLAWLLTVGDKRKKRMNGRYESWEGNNSEKEGVKGADETEKERRMRRKRGVVQRFARNVRLDLEFSWIRSERVLRSTILDIRPRTPSPSPSPLHDPSAASPIPSTPPIPQTPTPALLFTGRPRSTRPLPILPDTPPVYSEDPTHPVDARTPAESPRPAGELNSVRAYLSRINARLATAVAGAGAVGRDWVLGSVGRGWGSRGSETLPEYRSVG